MAGQAARAYRAEYLAGTDAILTGYGHAERTCPAATRATCPAGAGSSPACCLPTPVLPCSAFVALASGGNAGVVSSRRMAGAGCSVA